MLDCKIENQLAYLARIKCSDGRVQAMDKNQDGALTVDDVAERYDCRHARCLPPCSLPLHIHCCSCSNALLLMHCCPCIVMLAARAGVVRRPAKPATLRCDHNQ